jgi:hypothetical protein
MGWAADIQIASASVARAIECSSCYERRASRLAIARNVHSLRGELGCGLSCRSEDMGSNGKWWEDVYLYCMIFQLRDVDKIACTNKKIHVVRERVDMRLTKLN